MTTAGVFILSLSLVLFELCLTRVLSVVFYYHTAFLAISVALLGIGAGGIWVHLSQRRYSPGVLAALVALAMAVLPALLPILKPAYSVVEQQGGFAFFGALGSYALAAFLPFLLGSAAIATILTENQSRIGRLYAADLMGAAVGALLLILAMELFGGPAALLACGLAAAIAAFLLQVRPPLGAATLVISAGLLGAQIGFGLFDLRMDTGVEFTKWNAFSRVALLEDQGWDRGLSERRIDLLGGRVPNQREALIDLNAYAPYVQFDGDLSQVSWLRFGVENLAHRLLPPGRRIAIIGPGGGKDVLGALLFEPEEVLGIELNPILVDDLARGLLREYTGDIYGQPRVRIVVGEGRSELARSGERFDLILMNSVATWAAHSSGALNLTEATLFTKEAAKLYLDRLRPGGILSVSLWDDERHALPIRWIATVGADPDRVAVVGNRWTKSRWFTTVLIGKKPFTEEQRETLDRIAGEEDFDVLPLIDRAKVESTFNLAPAIDDRPFFFYTLRGGDALRFWVPETRSENAAYFSLIVSLLIVSLLSAVLIGVPLLFARARQGGTGLRGHEILYFAAIGAGFMVIEISAIQSLTLFLGHPTRALTIVFFGILFFSGLGSWWTSGLDLRARLRIVLLILTSLLVLGHWLPAGPLLLLLAPLGFLMGMAMPLGLSVVGSRSVKVIPFAWGVNGVVGVLASVLVILFAIEFGYRAAWTAGTLCYFVAALTRPRFVHNSD